MTEHKWLKLAGFLNECIYGMDQKECPYLKYRSQDQYQRLEALLTMSDEQTDALMKTCKLHSSDCKPVLVQKQESKWNLS